MSANLYTDARGTDAAYLSANLLIATLYALNMCDASPADAADSNRPATHIRELASGSGDTAYTATSTALVHVLTALLDGDSEAAGYAREIVSDWFGDPRAAQECVTLAREYMADMRADHDA